MKLADMTFEESRVAELIIIPEIDAMWQDEKTAELLDAAFGAKSGMTQGHAIKHLVSHLVCHCFESICKIVAALNHSKVDEVKKWKRGKVNEQIAELFDDDDLLSFFMSSEALDAAVQSMLSQMQEASLQKLQSSTLESNANAKTT